MSIPRLISGLCILGCCATAILLFASRPVRYRGQSHLERTGTRSIEARAGRLDIRRGQSLPDDGALGPTLCDDGPFFLGLGSFHGGIGYSYASCVSEDGSVVVGRGNTEHGSEAFRWTPATGMVGLAFAQANGVSADGSVIVGYRRLAGGSEAVGWTTSAGLFWLGSRPEFRFMEACAASADGSVIVGRVEGDRREEAFYWTQSDGTIHPLGQLTGGQNSTASAVSADGSVVVGGGDTSTGVVEAFRWTRASGMVGLGTLPGDITSEAAAVSGDGSVVVGHGDHEAFLWTEQDGMIGLGVLPGGSNVSFARGISADGTVVVGQSHSESGFQAVIWDVTREMRSLRDVLERQLGLAQQLSGWKLRAATAVSADGQVVVGWGTNPHGNHEGWIARLGASPSRSAQTRRVARTVGTESLESRLATRPVSQ